MSSVREFVDQDPGAGAESALELETKVHLKVYNNGKGTFFTFKTLSRYYAKMTLTPG